MFAALNNQTVDQFLLRRDGLGACLKYCKDNNADDGLAMRLVDNNSTQKQVGAVAAALAMSEARVALAVAAQ